MDSTTTAKQSCYNTLVYWSEILKHLNDDDHDDDNSIRNTIGSIDKSKLYLQKWIMSQVSELLDTVDDIKKWKKINFKTNKRTKSSI